MIAEKRAIAVAVLLVCVAVCVQAREGEPGADTPFRVEEADLNLGRVIAGETAVGTFVFHNDSGRDVRILKFQEQLCNRQKNRLI